MAVILQCKECLSRFLGCDLHEAELKKQRHKCVYSAGYDGLTVEELEKIVKGGELCYYAKELEQ